MGQTLSEPVVKKRTNLEFNDYMMVCSTCMQGWRVSMEDAHFHVLGKRGEGNYSCAEDYNFLKPTIRFLHKAGDDNYLWSPLRPNFIFSQIVPMLS